MNHGQEIQETENKHATFLERLESFLNEYRHLLLAGALAIFLGMFILSLSERTRAFLRAGLTARGGLISMLILFSLVMLSLLWSAGQRLDAALFRSFNSRGKRPAWMDQFMWVVTQIGNGVAALVLAAIFYWNHNRHLSLWISLALYGIAFLVGLTRIYVGAHYPRDVLGGALLGLVWGIVTSLVEAYIVG